METPHNTMKRRRRLRIRGAVICASIAALLVLLGQGVAVLEFRGYSLPRDLSVVIWMYWMGVLVMPSFILAGALGWNWGEGVDTLNGVQMITVLIVNGLLWSLLGVVAGQIAAYLSERRHHDTNAA